MIDNVKCLFVLTDGCVRNEMHLGPSAHRLMATEIYHGIDGKLLNPTEAADMAELESLSDSRPQSEPASESESVAGPPTQRHSRRGSAA